MTAVDPVEHLPRVRDACPDAEANQTLVEHLGPLLERIECPRCRGSCVVQVDSLRCLGCGAAYPVVDGIIDMRMERRETYWDDLYRTAAVAGVPQTSLTRQAECLRLAATGAQTVGSILWQALPVACGLLKEQSVSGGWAVEIGCGSGITSAALQTMGMVDHCILMDTSRSALLHARRLFRRLGREGFFLQADAFQSPLRTAACDLAYSGGLIEHFAGELLADIVGEHCRVANYVILTVPADQPGYWIGRAYLTLMNGLKWPFGFERPLDQATLFRLIEGHGYRVLGYKPRSLAHAVLQRLAARLRHRPQNALYHLAASRQPAFLTMEHNVLAGRRRMGQSQ